MSDKTKTEETKVRIGGWIERDMADFMTDFQKKYYNETGARLTQGMVLNMGLFALKSQEENKKDK